MPSFADETKTAGPIKMLYMGHTGAGKTGSIVALAAAGYNVRILDLDKGVQILYDYARNKEKSPYLQAKSGLWTAEQAAGTAKRLSYVAVSDTMTMLGAKGKEQLVSKGDAFPKVAALLNEWKDGETNLGNVATWGPGDVLVIDGLSRLSQAAFNHQLALNGRLLGRPEQSDYWFAQKMIEKILLTLYSDDVKCHVIMICHIAFIETEFGPTRGFPQTIGKAIAPQIGQYFNHTLLAKLSGQGENEKRVILTSTSGAIELKSAMPLRVAKEYPLATGLAEYFRDVGAPK